MKSLIFLSGQVKYIFVITLLSTLKAVESSDMWKEQRSTKGKAAEDNIYNCNMCKHDEHRSIY